MRNEDYNGWTNFETWKVNVEFLDGATSKQLFDRKCDPNEVEELIWEIVVEEELAEHLNVRDHSFAHHCIQAFFADVNWEELADHLNDWGETVIKAEA